MVTGSASMKRFIVFLGVVLLALFAFGIARLVTGPAQEHERGKQSLESTPSARLTSPPVILPCGPGLAAQDLAGVCRAKPNPTPGALEAVGELIPTEMKIQSKSRSKKIDRTF
jgi:HAMP domain-containing protein